MATADETISERETQHGKFADMARTAQFLKATVRTALGDRLIRQSQAEALDMICTKLARIACGDNSHSDHWHDIAGYARLVELELIGGD